ncbi:MAG: hypothetical protein KJZ84_18730 [Bryobacteraceae bacterium]|nr:hypothetical protein [Bryobacteraceae bacterium]
MRFLTLICLLILTPVVLPGNPPVSTVTNLQGVGAFPVMIAPLPPTATRRGITADQLKSMIEERLRAGCIALAEAASPRNEALILGVSVACSGEAPYCAIGLFLYFQAGVQLTDQRRTVAVVWSQGGVRIASEEAFSERWREDLLALIGQFVRDYRAANP